ncbi:hypothetical protein [Microcystis aeruginosa]|uniref:hypothetical protein n=1 Tax=Microcystis aeruginosa TaxID=1126 RepID=UPI00232E4409|nr:hypothetical protein [Microcystis aeruginosa]MDB9410993.1 hypothetical protein [Microcystis aeruginosa CS-567/02]
MPAWEKNALLISYFLANHPKIDFIIPVYPVIPSIVSPVISIGLKGGLTAATAFTSPEKERLKLGMRIGTI